MIRPQTTAKLLEWSIRLLAFTGGAASTVVGSWLSSKLRIYHDQRNAHRDELKQKVLIPLRDGLSERLNPLLFHHTAPIRVKPGVITEFRKKVAVTESQVEWGDALVTDLPGAIVISSLDSTLLEDCRKTHFEKLISEIEAFVRRCDDYTSESHLWVMDLAEEILKESGLPAFPNPVVGGSGPAPYVMHNRLAVFLYKRLFNLTAPALETSAIGMGWGLNGEDATLACGSEAQIVKLPTMLNHFLKVHENRARTLEEQARKLHKEFNELLPKMNYAIASRRLRKRCDLVPFF
jgi:hypothetical protein